MASNAIELPSGSVPLERTAQADRSFHRLAFLATLLAVVSAMAATCCTIRLASIGHPVGFPAPSPAGVCALALVAIGLAALVSHALSRPLYGLVTRLERSQSDGSWTADFPEDSATREVNLLAAAINRAANAVTHSNERLDQAVLDFVDTMAQALDARDPCTAGHSQRVSEYATAIAVTMGMAPSEIETIREGARLHDIGKIGISDSLLRKPASLTAQEYETIKAHAQIGRRFLERMAAFERYLPFAELHHEDFDGHGYPHGLKGDQVPLAVRIVRVADVFDALTTDRSYRQAVSPDRAFEMISAHAGTKFDPAVVRALRTTMGAAAPVCEAAPQAIGCVPQV